MSDYLVALLLGFSFGNLWLCVLLVFSLQTTDRSTCGGYLVGRALAILLLSVISAIIGTVVTIQKPTLNVASGIFLLIFGGYLIATRLLQWHPPWRKTKSMHSSAECNCTEDCQKCPVSSRSLYAKTCADCSDHKVCAAEEPEMEPLSRQARTQWNRSVDHKQPQGFWLGMLLGAMRGAVLCSKLIVLLPMLLSATIFKAIGLGAVFALSSSIYPLIGFLFGSIALRFIKYKRSLFLTSCASLLIAGIWYLQIGITTW